MSHTVSRLTLLVCLGLATFLFTTACGESNFAGGGGTNAADKSDTFQSGTKGDGSDGPVDDLDVENDNDLDGDGFPDDEPLNDADGNRRGVQTFPLKTESRKIDMVWVIDNSDSMTDEAQKVRDNFDEFMQNVASQTDIKIALISASNAGAFGNTGVTLPASARPSDKHVDARVSSTNVLAVAAAATCPKETSTVAQSVAAGGAQPKQQICDNDMDMTEQKPLDNGIFGIPGLIPYNMVAGLENPAEVTAVRGELASFFRKDAIGMYVFVTDDDALGVTAKNFGSMVSPHLGGQTPKVFSFQGIQNSGPGCDVTRRGESYENLAGSSGGGTFDICEDDWKPQFDKLTDKVVEIAKGQFALEERSVVRISSVTIDDDELSESDYKLQGNQVVIDDAVLERYKEAEVKVVYYFEPK